MKKCARYAGLVLVVLLVMVFQSCDLLTGWISGCTVVQADGWHGPFSLTTSHPLSSSGYHYESFCVSAVGGTTYRFGLQTDVRGVGLSVFHNGVEDEVLWTYGANEAWDTRLVPESGLVSFSVWVNRDRISSGSARYSFYLAPD